MHDGSKPMSELPGTIALLFVSLSVDLGVRLVGYAKVNEVNEVIGEK